MGQETVYSDFIVRADRYLAGFRADSYANLGCRNAVKCAQAGHCIKIHPLVGKPESEVGAGITAAMNECPPFSGLVDAEGL